MADIQNAKRQGTGQTWQEAYQDVDKTVASLRDLNEDFASFVADYNGFSDERKQRLQEYLDTLGDISEHWEEVNSWIDQNSESTKAFVGGLGDVRSIFHDIISLTGGIRRETQERINLARRVERLAGDSLTALRQESGLNSRIVELQRSKGTSLREQVEYQAKLITGQELIQGVDRRADLASQVNISNLQKAREQEARKLAILQDQVKALQEQRSTGESRSLIRSLQEEIRYREQNIEFLDLENLKAVQGLEDILSRRKELLRIQRAALSGSTEKGGAGENAMPASRVDAVAKILSKFQQSDTANKLKEDYNRWVTDRVQALEELETARRAAAAVEEESISRLKDLHVKVNEELLKSRDRIKEVAENIQNLLNESGISGSTNGLGIGRFGALTDELQDEILGYQKAKQKQKDLEQELERVAALWTQGNTNLGSLANRPEEYELLSREVDRLKSQHEDLQKELEKATQEVENFNLAGKNAVSRFTEGFTTADFGGETLEDIQKAIEKSNLLEEALRNLQKVRTDLGKERVNAEYFLGDLSKSAVGKVARGVNLKKALAPEGSRWDPTANRYRDKKSGAFVEGADDNRVAAAEKWREANQKARDLSEEIVTNLRAKTGIQLNLKSLSDDQIKNLLAELELGDQAVKLAKDRKVEEEAINSVQEAARERVRRAEEYRKHVFETEFSLLSKISEAMKGNIAWATLGLMLALAMYRQLLKFDEEAVKTKRVIGQWADASALANTKFVTGTEVLKTMRELGEQFHINPVQVFPPEELARISQAQKLTGMTSQAAGNLAVQSRIIGKNANTYRDSIATGANQANRLNHSAVNLSAVQNDVLNTSRAIALSYGKNVEALSRAAGAAAALGMNLQQVENISKNLMNFESSIEAEMQAQLLTGMQLNLAKAREYALNNDLEGVAREVGRQGMNAAKFSHMNYIQQENMAKALGMSREEMSKMLIMQEINRGLTAEQVAAMTGMRRQDIEALSAQEKWQTMKQRFLESLIPLLEPVLQVTSDIFRLLNPLLGIISKIAGWISRIFNVIPENWVYLRSIVGLFAVAIPALLLKGSLIGKVFTGIFTTVGNIGKGILGWVTNLGKAKVASQAANIGGTQPGANTLNSSVGGIGRNTGNLLKGAAAMLVIAGALYVTAKAAQEFARVSWEDIGKAGVALVGLSLTTTLVGKALSKAGPELLYGSLSLAAFGVALIPVAFALRLAAPAFEAFANVVVAVGTAIKSAFEGVATVTTTVFTGITSLLTEVTLEKAAALVAVGAGFGALAVGVGAASAALLLFPANKFGRALALISSRPRPQSLMESSENSRENIEAAVQNVVIKQAEVKASAQRISVEQKSADLSKIEKKLDNVITAIKSATPTDWNWLEFNRTQMVNA